MNLKKQYYSMDRDQFDDYLTSLKNDPETVRFFATRPDNTFFHTDNESVRLLLELHRQQMQFDQLVASLSSRKKDFISESLIIDEIKTTNATENIYSTRKDIFGLMNQVSSIKDRKIRSILQAYQSMNTADSQIRDLQSIRKLYDQMMDGAFESRADRPDGTIFRKDSVAISNGMKTVHKGFYPEAEIIRGMEEFLAVYQNPKMDIYLRLILSHFLFETIHPFYDGNGRFGRLLMSLELLNDQDTLSAYLISSSINRKKKEYYSALEEARKFHSFGCLNSYFTQIATLLADGIENANQRMEQCEKECQKWIQESRRRNLTKSEHKILEYLIEASCFSYYGTTNEKIMESCAVSKRTVISTIGKLRSENLLTDTKIGAFDYHKINGIEFMKADDEPDFAYRGRKMAAEGKN